MNCYELKDNGLLFRIRIIPGAKQDMVIGVVEGRLKIALRALPIHGKANLALIKYLSKKLKIPQKCWFIRSGHSARNKEIWLPKESLTSIQRFLSEIDK